LIQAQSFSTKTAKINFYSKTPVEDIKAEANDAMAVLNTTTNKISFTVKITSFQFPDKLMQEHFNEKYMESSKKGYEIASFFGTINEKIDYTKDGTYNVTVNGKLKVHNVEQPRTMTGVITIKDGKVNVTSTFKVKCADHKIEIPSVVTKKIAEEIDVTVNADLKK
ncbi:MAG TPA: YceI family protein, partial [Cyclobacteriaceae bacterium]|nr:YceI family protein [Cyclobacteriaceae bacterium]